MRARAIAAAAAALAAGGASAAAPSLSGVWLIQHPVAAVRTTDGKAPPLRPAAARVYQANIAARAHGDLSFDNASWCSAVGTPRTMFIDYPFEIVDRPPYVAILSEWNWWARTVYLPGALGAAATEKGAPQSGTTLFLGGRDPDGPMGSSNGRRVGDALVIETTGFKANTLIDNSGLPHGDRMTVTETLRLRSPDVLEDRMRIDDPDTFERPWETVATYHRQSQPIREDVCLDRIRAGMPAVRD